MITLSRLLQLSGRLSGPVTRPSLLRELASLAEAPKATPPAAGVIRLYRGDNSKIDKFTMAKTSMTSLFGQGIYLTDNKRVAGDYTSKGRSDAGDVIFRYSGSNIKKATVIDVFVRRMARTIDETGRDRSHELRFWTAAVPYSDGGDFGSVTNDLRAREQAARLDFARRKWLEMAQGYEVRVKLDGTAVIQKKARIHSGKVSVFDVPTAYLRVLHADDAIPDAVASVMAYILRREQDGATAREMQGFIDHAKQEEGGAPSFRDVYTSLTRESGLSTDSGAAALIEELQEMGYNGIEYVGGITMGNGAKHRAFVFWDEDAINHYRVAERRLAEGRAQKLPATATNIKLAKAYLYKKWIEQAAVTGRPAPTDLSAACKAASLFAQAIFGGRIEGNEFHQWVVLPGDGTLIDLSEDAQDVAALKRGIIPAYALPYAREYGLTPPAFLYTQDRRFIGSEGHASAMASWQTRVSVWAQDFLHEITGTKPTVPEFRKVGVIDGLALFKRATWYCLTDDGKAPVTVKDGNVVYYLSVKDNHVWAQMSPEPAHYSAQISALKHKLKI